VLQQLSLLDGPVAPLGGDSHSIRIRASRRARRLTLKVVPPYQIELVVPHGTSPRDVEAFVSESHEWIQRTRRELDRRYPTMMKRLPKRIELAAVGATYEVAIRVRPSAETRLTASPGQLLLTVADELEPAGFECLRQWLLAQGRAMLRPWLLEEATAMGVEPQGVQIRTQRTRWGSCSERGVVSLNAASLLLAAPVARYLLIHELCHLVHLNHSARYWRLVDRYDPNYRDHDKILSESWSQIPVWALPK
jgi:predicted metal-dependent hydrolase